jgi:excisionase family DNA binding protein
MEGLLTAREVEVERLLNAREVADLLGFSAATIVDWAERDEIPSFKMGGRLRFRLSELEAWLAERRKGALVKVGAEVAPQSAKPAVAGIRASREDEHGQDTAA